MIDMMRRCGFFFLLFCSILFVEIASAETQIDESAPPEISFPIFEAVTIRATHSHRHFLQPLRLNNQTAQILELSLTLESEGDDQALLPVVIPSNISLLPKTLQTVNIRIMPPEDNLENFIQDQTYRIIGTRHADGARVELGRFIVKFTEN